MAPDSVQSPYERALLSRHVFAYSQVTGRYIDKGDRLLEIGCGEGYGSALMAGKAGSVTAIDSGADAVAHAAEKYKAGNLEFKAYAGEVLPFQDGEFDKVVSFQVIEHVKDPSAFVKETARVLKPGGRLYLTTPNRVHRLKEGQKPWYKFHIREFSAGEIPPLLSPFFRSCKVGFISVPPEYFEMEKKVARIATLAQKLDPLGLRDRIPYGLKQFVFRLISKKAGTAGLDAAPAEFSLIEDDRNGLDLWIEAVR